VSVVCALHLQFNCTAKLDLSNRADSSKAGHGTKDKVQNTRNNHITRVEALQGSLKEVDKTKAQAFRSRQISSLMRMKRSMRLSQACKLLGHSEKLPVCTVLINWGIVRLYFSAYSNVENDRKIESSDFESLV